MSFINRIQSYDAEYGIPRRADEPYLPSYQAFLRCTQDAGRFIFSIVLGLLSATFLFIGAYYFGVGFYAQLVFATLILIALLVCLIEALQILTPYYQFNQLLTYGTAYWASPLYLQGAGFAKPIAQQLEHGELALGKLPRALREPYRFVLTKETALGSLVFFGPPRSGKSVLLMNYLRSLAMSGWSCVIIDPKGELFENCAHYFDRGYRLDFSNPEYSDRWNFIPLCKDDKEYAHMMASIMLGIEGTRYTSADPFWQEAELALLTAILLYLPKIVDLPLPAHIHEFIALRSFKELCDELGNCSDREIQVQWGTFTKAPEQTRGSVFTGLAAKINPFTIDAAKAVSAAIRPEELKQGAHYIDFESLRKPKTAIFVVIPEGAASRYKLPLATFVGQAIEHLRASEVDDVTTPVLFVVDEAAHIPIVNLKEIPGVGRGRKFGVMLFYQNISQGYDMYGEHGFNAILGSINTKTFLPGCDLITARYASELVGQTTVWGRAFDDAPGTQYDKTRTTESARPLMDSSEVRQLPMHKQAITIIETMPPVKWTYPKPVNTGDRYLPRKYGKPVVISFIEAERVTRVKRLKSDTSQKLLPQKAEEKVTTPVAASVGHDEEKQTLELKPDQPESEKFLKQIVKKEVRKSFGHLRDIVNGSIPQVLS